MVAYFEGVPPLKLHLSPDAKPVDVAQTSRIPVQWVNKVWAGLQWDMALRVINWVP